MVDGPAPARQGDAEPGEIDDLGSQTTQQRLRQQIKDAERRADRVAFAEHRDRVRTDLGAPLTASRGSGDCLALALLPLGLILLVVHPLPAIVVLVTVGWLYLAGSDRRERDQRAIRAADAEAERRWQQRRQDEAEDSQSS